LDGKGDSVAQEDYAFHRTEPACEDKAASASGCLVEEILEGCRSKVYIQAQLGKGLKEAILSFFFFAF
jgi:hypothetical protein